MNNIHYIVRSVRRYVMLIIIMDYLLYKLLENNSISLNFLSRSEAKDLLGDDWVQIHRRVVQQHANQYKRIAWSKV